MPTNTPEPASTPRNAYLVGGGIAALAAAALLIRDGGMDGARVHVFEQLDRFGGSLDGTGDAEHGYVIRGGRMFEAHFACTYDLFDSIPSLSCPGQSVSEDIHAFTREIVPSSHSRLVAGRRRIEAPPLGLNLGDKWKLARLLLRSEASLGRLRIEDYFSAHFFTTNFWIMWCSMFAFQPWHSLAELRRYQRRFMHLMPGFNRLEGIHRTPLNQYDALVAPLLHWLAQRRVNLHTGVAVNDLGFDGDGSHCVVTRIVYADGAGAQHIDVGVDDLVLVTLGSMTADSSLGTHSAPPVWDSDLEHGAWGLWRRIARRSPHFGRPEVFCGEVEKSRWESFTVTLPEVGFFEFMEQFTGNRAGSGGLVTFRDSNWLLSIVLAHQPHFSAQPPETYVFWGYALYPDRAGNRVGKAMCACSGREILEELAFHLPIDAAGRDLFAAANCIPCALPFITSQFMPRTAGDRPAVIPPGARNFAFLGQFCEIPDDTVFTVEYSIRSAQIAVYRSLALARPVTPLYRGYRDPRVVLRALRAMA